MLLLDGAHNDHSPTALKRAMETTVWGWNTLWQPSISPLMGGRLGSTEPFRVEQFSYVETMLAFSFTQ